MQRQIVTLLSLMFLASCGGDNPAMPDDAGHPVASGVYLYRLVTAEEILTRKLILLR